MDKEALIQHIQQWRTIRQIAKELGSSYTNVRYWLKVHGLETRRGPYGRMPKDPEDLKSHPRKCACGETNPDKFYGHKTTVCAKCHLAQGMTKGRNNRARAIELLGSSCRNCGFDKFQSALDVHHIDPSKKDPGFRHWRYWSWDRLEKELQFCVLLCRNCHSAYHSGELEISWTVSRSGDCAGLKSRKTRFEPETVHQPRCTIDHVPSTRQPDR